MSTPSLLNVPYRLKAGTLYSQIPETGAGDFTVARVTSPTTNRSTRVNSLGFIELVNDNVPRLDYPLGGAVNGCPALLVEPSAENLLFYSEEFDNGYWFKSTTTVQTNAAISPSNTLTADNIYPNSTGADRRFQRAVPVTSGTTYTFSIFAKANGLNWIRFSSPQFNLFAWFNVQSGTIGSVQAGLTAKIENYGNGWYRCSVTQTATSTTTGQFYINPTDGDNTSNVTASGTNGVLFWGAQGETGTIATSYIYTTTAAITRADEVINKTGVSSLIGQTEGTAYLELEFKDVASAMLLFLDVGGSSQYIRITKNASNAINVLVLNTSGSQSLFTSSSNPVGIYKLALAYKSGDNAMSINGATPLTSANTSNYPTSSLSRILLSDTPVGLKPLNGRIRAFALYPNRLSNTELATLTTP